ncbi:hypothetical protein M6D93_19060 [Jatrophihabitans telluris]|uniref:Uncharacterized protein n=1 Tax=Jatrophihabitans telluris TaxID=2038343 RepID=A0ABY4QXZ3_9ACTN|nr:hypothetical protein [Jatrophihabitans telluris]UQX88358.1 hypothetical protein M6D93_19060 [Jatrophihabitans telluris]
MDTATLVSAWDLLVGMNQGHFMLYTDEPHTVDPREKSRIVQAAVSGTGIAQHFGTVVVTSPHQKNYAMGLRVEVFDAHPDDDLDDWQEAFELDLPVKTSGLIYDSPGMSSFKIPVRPGEQHLLITGLGFSDHDRPSAETPGDRWRIRLWPCEEHHQSTRLKAAS